MAEHLSWYTVDPRTPLYTVTHRRFAFMHPLLSTEVCLVQKKKGNLWLWNYSLKRISKATWHETGDMEH